MFSSLLAQNRYLTKKGMINFEASVPSFEEIKAKSTSVTAILNTENGDFASLVLMNSFRFKVALMEEHFNENYVESERYPKAILKGTLTDFNLNRITDTEVSFRFRGSLTMHGETKPLETDIFIKKHDKGLQLRSDFSLQPEHFNIKIPKIVRKKIAHTVTVSALFDLYAKR